MTLTNGEMEDLLLMFKRYPKFEELTLTIMEACLNEFNGELPVTKRCIELELESFTDDFNEFLNESN